MTFQRIYHLNPKELEIIVNLHHQVLDESFLNKFGKNFLKIIYRSIIQNKRNIFLVALDKEKIVGFLVATPDSSYFIRQSINRHFSQLIWEIIKSIFLSPKLFIDLFLWLIRSRNKLQTPKAELQFIAVNSDYQGRGIGTFLVDILNQEFEKLKITSYKVGTKSNNDASNRFYKKLGFDYIKKIEIFGDHFNFYISPHLFTPNPAESIPTIVRLQTIRILSYICILFFISAFTIKSFESMIFVPFYDFDEAHRAENAKRMKEYQSYFVPLTGSSFDRVDHLKIPIKDDPVLHLYYHLERPFLVYLSMILSISIFGTDEWAYRLPSFLAGISTILVLFFFSKKIVPSYNFIALVIGMVTLITSSDLWLSSQYAQMDTGITLFLFVSLLSLIYFVSCKKTSYLCLSGLAFSLGVFSKGQPAIIFVFPLIYLLIAKKISLKEFGIFTLSALVLLVPWLTYLTLKFGVVDVVTTFSGFALYSASIIYIHQVAPFFWYVRWWWESLRPGWSLFLALVIYDITQKQLDWKKLTLLTYIFGGLLAFSVPVNKIWWYVLPLIPAISFYIFMSINTYLANNRQKILNLSIVIILASIPIFLATTNTVALIYGIVMVFLSFLLLIIRFPTFSQKGYKKISVIFLVVIVTSLFLFGLRFPNIIPYHKSTKTVATYYKNLPGKKCLWVYDMPGEAVLFYSNAGEVGVYNDNSTLYGHCKHYLMTASEYKKIPILRDKKLLFRRGSMNLLEL